MGALPTTLRSCQSVAVVVYANYRGHLQVEFCGRRYQDYILRNRRMNMKKLFALLGIAALLAFGLFVGKSVTAPQQASACGWYYQAYGPAGYSSYFNSATGRYASVGFQ